MSVYANNPQAVMNGFYSASRNVFLTLSIGIAMYGFSESFKIGASKHIVKDISLLIFIFSFVLGVTNVYMFNNYIKELEKDKAKGNILPNYIDLKSWKIHIYIKSYMILLVLLIIIAGFIRLLNRRFD
jgi:hypothetical protein